MRALFLVTHTADCENKHRSLSCLGHEVIVEQYDNRPHDRHRELVALALRLQPDVVVYVGAIEQYHGRPVPSADVLRELRDIAPTVHICGDASDKPWWPLLELYELRECFSAQVSIDGNHETPIADFATGIVTLTPTDPALFHPQLPWEQRASACFAGGLGHGERRRMIECLTDEGLVQWLDASAGLPLAEMCRFMTRCKIAVNNPMNGTGDGVHVKGRVVEAGWAGSCLLERENPCTARWFLPDEYLRYENPASAEEQLRWALENDDEVRAIAARFRARIEAEHHPLVFWKNVLDLAGVAA